SHSRDAVWRSDLIVVVCAWLAALALNLVRFANDLLVFASPDFGLIKFPPQLTRVSRVLPQKINPYPLSMLRGLGATLAALPNSLIMLHLTPTGQVDHRVHSQGELIDGLAKGRDALELARKIVQSLTLNRQAAEAHCRRHFIQSMDVAEDLALKGMDYEAAWQCLRDCMSAEGEFDEEFAHRVSRACARQGLNVSVKDILAAADPLGAVEAKQQTGACSSQAMIKQLRDLSLECARRQSTIEVRARAIRDVLRERYVSLQIEV
ncbi:MAG: lyase family protein, partial [Bdellovibrionales bacterium]